MRQLVPSGEAVIDSVVVVVLSLASVSVCFEWERIRGNDRL